jgi:hypothetical protein
MAGFWDVNSITAENLNKVGPLFDGVVGTNGQYQDLYAAMVSPSGPQWKRVLLIPGATLSQALTLSSSHNSGCIVNVGPKYLPISTAYAWTIQADDFRIEGIDIRNSAGVALTVTGARMQATRCTFNYSSSHGLFLSGGSSHYLWSCMAYGNGGDGFRIAAGLAVVTVIGCHSQGNTGYGLRDLAASGSQLIAVGNTVWGNTAGQITTTSTLLAANKTS